MGPESLSTFRRRHAYENFHPTFFIIEGVFPSYTYVIYVWFYQLILIVRVLYFTRSCCNSVNSPFKAEQCCARDPKFWWRLAVAQHMLGFVQGENNSVVLVDYLMKANDSIYYAIRIGANDKDSYSWCVRHPQWKILQTSFKRKYDCWFDALCRTAIIDGILGQQSTHFRVKLATAYRFKVPFSRVKTVSC